VISKAKKIIGSPIVYTSKNKKRKPEDIDLCRKKDPQKRTRKKREKREAKNELIARA
jgi:hypothetical protein